MRATSMRKLIGTAAALMLVGATLLTTGSALAAKPTDGTRHLYVGPDSNYKLNPGLLTFTPVSAGGQSASNVYVKNVDNQTLTHVVITFARTQGGATISQVYGTASSYCLPLGDTTVTCDFGNLLAGTTRDFTLLIDASIAGTFTFSGTVIFNESTNPNGGNPQISTVSGTLAVGETSCDSFATFLPPGIAKTLTPDTGDCASDPQRSGLGVPANANGNVIFINDANDPTSCPAGYSCFGKEVVAGVNGGDTILPYLTWYITYSADTIGNRNPKLVAFAHDSYIILAGKKGACGAVFTKDCIAGYTVNADGSVTFEIHTATNTSMRGLG
ncbi:MAG TPA: hypothetical protein VGJ71_11095 [Candidatus Limnocylindrales bacterium]